MSNKYKVFDNTKAHFITITVIDWIDLFTRLKYKHILVESLAYCQNHKRLQIYAWVLMPSHLHMICKSENDSALSDIMRDFKTFTSKAILKAVVNEPESRREWLLEKFAKACEHLSRKQQYKVWQNGYHAEEIRTNDFLKTKLNYIHQNPVKDEIVEHPEDYLYSSARNYAELEYKLEIERINLSLLF